MSEYIKLFRFNKPIGIFLLFWPCAWGVAFSQWYNKNIYNFFYFLIIFFIGSVLMRTAGCIYNDIIDKDLDKKVERTKNRPIASNKISKPKAWLLILLFLAPSLLILFSFNKFSIILGLISGLFVLTYPFMKRITFWPQVHLGIVFNWGVLLGWSVIFENITIEIIVLYLAAVFWTLGYDTIYATQDLKDDIKNKIKSTAVKFKFDIKNFLFFSYITSITFFVALGFLTKKNFLFFLCILLASAHLINQVLIIKKYGYRNKTKIEKIFKSNNFFGLIIFIILTIYIYA